jgi:hypothetical protein
VSYSHAGEAPIRRRLGRTGGRYPAGARAAPALAKNWHAPYISASSLMHPPLPLRRRSPGCLGIAGSSRRHPQRYNH